MSHIPVLLNEIIHLLNLKAGENVIDATFGAGGYTLAFAKQVGSSGKVLAIETDEGAFERAKNLALPQNILVTKANFSQLKEVARKEELEKIDVIIFDLGLSTELIEDASRGFSFQKNGPLDMRFDKSLGTTASDIVNNASEKELEIIFKEYGEDRLSKNIAKAIVKARAVKILETTFQLGQILEEVCSGRFKPYLQKTKARIFQALRIAVNDELEILEKTLPEAFTILKIGGRLGVVSYHSLEDRIVKQYFKSLSKGCVCPPDFPTCVCGKKAKGMLVTRKAIRPTEKEVIDNPRSRSAKLRIVKKIAA